MVYIQKLFSGLIHKTFQNCFNAFKAHRRRKIKYEYSEGLTAGVSIKRTKFVGIQSIFYLYLLFTSFELIDFLAIKHVRVLL